MILNAKLDYMDCLAQMIMEIAENRWPSQCMIDAALGYAVILGFSETDIEELQSALMG